MATVTRGKVLNKLPSRGRGTCPLCGRTRIKLIHNGMSADGAALQVCKNCRTKRRPLSPSLAASGVSQ